MAGAGYFEFSTGTVLTAVQCNTLFNEQTIMVFASSSARDTALSSAKAEGMFSFLKDTDALTYYDGSSWITVDLAGDITGVTAGTALSGGGTSGTVTVNVDVKGATSATATTSDYMLISDVDDSNATKRAVISDITALVPQGDLTGLTAGTNIDITSATGPVPTITLAIDAAVEFGSDGSGVDCSWHSDTGSDLMFWDSSAESLTITGTAGQNALVVAAGDLSLNSAPVTSWTDANIILAQQVFVS